MADDKMVHFIKNILFDHVVLISWSPAYELGIPVIDEQHRAIVAIINSLFYAIKTGHGETMLEPISRMMCEYTRIHFEFEEEYLRRCNFFEMLNHRRLHNELIDKLVAIGEDNIYKRDSEHFLQFLKEWWINHICEKDMVFRNYLMGLKDN